MLLGGMLSECKRILNKMVLKKLHNPEDGQMRIVGLMSITGSNLARIIEYQKKIEREEGWAPYEVVAIFTDNPSSSAVKIGGDHNLPVVVRDLKAFCLERGTSKSDMDARREFDEGTVEALSKYGATVAAYAGYMSIATQSLIGAFLGVNVHPADLSIINDDGSRKYTGDHAVRDAILAGEKQLRSTTHIIERRVDHGRILMRSSPLEVVLPDGFDLGDETAVKRIAKEHQGRLKEIGDWVIFPRTLEYIAEGVFEEDDERRLYAYGKLIPNGLDASPRYR